jgi:uncharacterized C2H2 Zn-finger protein
VPGRPCMVFVAMAAWMLACPHCEKSFVHAQIEIKQMLDYILPEKPTFPDGGMDLECPNCGQVARYQTSDLTYRA